MLLFLLSDQCIYIIQAQCPLVSNVVISDLLHWD